MTLTPQADFRRGIRELDEQAEEARLGAQWDPVRCAEIGSDWRRWCKLLLTLSQAVALRDYDALELPVFCVSAREYAKLHGRTNEGEAGTFKTPEETGVPALAAHIKGKSTSRR